MYPASQSAARRPIANSTVIAPECIRGRTSTLCPNVACTQPCYTNLCFSLRARDTCSAFFDESFELLSRRDTGSAYTPIIGDTATVICLHCANPIVV